MSSHDVLSFDYNEAYNGNGPAYIGSLRCGGPISRMIQTMNDTGLRLGKVFNAERPGRSDDCKWTYEKNLNFMAGVIAARRPVILTSHPSAYNRPEKRIGVTHHEILWLTENGYTASPDFFNADRTMFFPPVYHRVPKLSMYTDDDGQLMCGYVPWDSGISVRYKNFIHQLQDMVEQIPKRQCNEYKRHDNWRRY